MRNILNWLVVVVAGVVVAPSVRADELDQRSVIVIRIDGLAGFYFDDEQARLPTLRRLADEGALCSRMQCSFPTVTWPNHTTLVTGVPPAVHGVLGNNVVDRLSGETVKLIGDSKFDKEQLVRATTIYDAAHAAGLTTAAVLWPATRNASTLNWTLPDVYSQELFERYATPDWLEELRAANVPVAMRGIWVDDDSTMARCDWLSTQAAVHVVKHHRPALLLLHLLVADAVQHTFGPRSPEAYWALSYADDRVREVLDAVEQAGLASQTTIVVVSDHGFFAIDRVIQPNVAFKQAGLLQVENRQIVQKQAYALSQGGAAAVYLFDRAKASQLAPQIVELLGQIEGVERVLLPDQFAELGQPTPREHPWAPDLWLAAKDGYVFWHGVETDEIVAQGMPSGAPNYRGMHGYLPTHRNMQGTFLLHGAGVRAGSKLDEMSNLDVAPTVAHLLGISLPTAHGRVLKSTLE